MLLFSRLNASFLTRALLFLGVGKMSHFDMSNEQCGFNLDQIREMWFMQYCGQKAGWYPGITRKKRVECEKFAHQMGIKQVPRLLDHEGATWYKALRKAGLSSF